jgi:hypothetical protein
MTWSTEREDKAPTDPGESSVMWGAERDAEAPTELGECGGHFWAPA